VMIICIEFQVRLSAHNNSSFLLAILYFHPFSLHSFLSPVLFLVYYLCIDWKVVYYLFKLACNRPCVILVTDKHRGTR
jgi:hypothetical protein